MQAVEYEMAQQTQETPFFGAQMPNYGGNRCDSNALFPALPNFPIEGYATALR